jgi:hypothetical protein
MQVVLAEGLEGGQLRVRAVLLLGGGCGGFEYRVAVLRLQFTQFGSRPAFAIKPPFFDRHDFSPTRSASLS